MVLLDSNSGSTFKMDLYQKTNQRLKRVTKTANTFHRTNSCLELNIKIVINVYWLFV